MAAGSGSGATGLFGLGCIIGPGTKRGWSSASARELTKPGAASAKARQIITETRICLEYLGSILLNLIAIQFPAVREGSEQSEVVSDISLPPTNTTRWTAPRKAMIVRAVQNGLLSLENACERYSLSREEFISWEHAMERNGLTGLRAKRRQTSRETIRK